MLQRHEMSRNSFQMRSNWLENGPGMKIAGEKLGSLDIKKHQFSSFEDQHPSSVEDPQGPPPDPILVICFTGSTQFHGGFCPIGAWHHERAKMEICQGCSCCEFRRFLNCMTSSGSALSVDMSHVGGDVQC